MNATVASAIVFAGLGWALMLILDSFGISWSFLQSFAVCWFAGFWLGMAKS